MIGSVDVFPDLVVYAIDIIRDGLSSVALYQADITYFPLGRVATQDNMADAVIHNQGERGETPDMLARSAIKDLAPGQPVLQEMVASRERDHSLSRCLSNKRVSMFSFINANQTPGTFKNC